jgi:hypothetical protein
MAKSEQLTWEVCIVFSPSRTLAEPHGSRFSHYVRIHLGGYQEPLMNTIHACLGAIIYLILDVMVAIQKILPNAIRNALEIFIE